MVNTPFVEASQLSSEIHLYAIDLSVDPRDMDLLDETECHRAAQFKFDIHRSRYINAHVGLRKYLMCYTHTNPVILTDKNGKPYLKDFTQIEFNLSHSEALAVCAITAGTPVGVDVEYIHRQVDFAGIAERYFPHEKFDDFFQHWTRKEAYLKCLGEGIAYGLDKPIPNDYKIYDFRPREGYTAALVFRNCDKEIKDICGKISGL